MRLLLDTHVWLWWQLGSPRFGDESKRLLFDAGSTLYLSAASAWEIAIKCASGKLVLPAPPASYIRERAAREDFRVVDIRLEHALIAGSLERHHDDPFDRMLVAQCIVDGFRLVTADHRLAAYGMDLVTI